MMLKKLLVLGVVFCALTTALPNSKAIVDIQSGSSRALLSNKIEGWKGFFSGDSSCVSVIKNGAICGFTAVSAGLKCAWSYIKCIIPKCSKCCGGGIFSWACVPCKCSWDCSSKKCKEEFNNVANSCKIATDGCVKAFNHLGNATKKFFENVGNAIKTIANKIKHAAEWVAQKAWAAVKWVWDQILKFLDLIKFFEVAKAIGQVFQCFGKLGSSSSINNASKQAGNVKNIAQGQGKNGIISKIDSYIPGFKAFVCCMQSTAIGKVLNKWGQSLKSFHQNWKGLKVGSFLDDPALVVSLAASVASGYSVGTSLDIAISTAFNIGLYWTFCAGFVTDVGVGVSIVVNLFRKFSFIPGQSVAVSFSVGIPETPIGVGAGVVLPIGDSGIDFGAVNVEVGASNGISPVSVGGHVCDTIKLVEFNLIELLGNILTANNECPSTIPTNPGSAPAVAPAQKDKQLTYGAQKKANWWGSLDKKGWSKCASGSALVGLYRNSCNNLHCLEEGDCREASDGKKFTSCYNHNVWSCFDHKGTCSCNTNYFMAGLYRNDCDWIYCIEEFWCCTIPGSKYAYSPKTANWWGSFDKKGWSHVPTNSWMTGLMRNESKYKELYAIEEARYSAPIAKVNAVVIEEIEQPIMEENRRLMPNTILKAHKEKVIENVEAELREELKLREAERRLAEIESVAEGIEDGADAGPNNSPYKKIDTDTCGPQNIAAQKKFEEVDGVTKLVDKLVLTKLCSPLCQNHNAGESEPKLCRALRARACGRGLLGSRLNSEGKCCRLLLSDPEDLTFTIRKHCAAIGAFSKPTRKQFCAAAQSTAAAIQNNFGIVNTILDGCAEHFNDRVCNLLKGKKTAGEFGDIARKLCSSGSGMEQFGNAAMIGVGVAFTFVIGFGIKKLRSKNDDIVYEKLPDF